MVRHKTRWMLLSLDFGGSRFTENGSEVQLFPTRKDFLKAVQDNIISCFGVSSSDAAIELQVRLCDSKTGLALVRISRENYSVVRASLTMMTSLPVSPTSGEVSSKHDNQSTQQKRLMCNVSTVSVHGSVRTAKRATMRKIRKLYRLRIGYMKEHVTQKHQQYINKECRAMEDMLQKIQAID